MQKLATFIPTKLLHFNTLPALLYNFMKSFDTDWIGKVLTTILFLLSTSPILHYSTYFSLFFKSWVWKLILILLQSMITLLFYKESLCTTFNPIDSIVLRDPLYPNCTWYTMINCAWYALIRSWPQISTKSVPVGRL